MPKITPYTQTTAFQYQPLGLEGFAQPLAQMQQSLDVTKSAIQDTDFDMDTLSVDDPAAKMRIKQYKDTRDELLENLLKTNNYSDAAVKIKKLNKLYNKDPERTAYETNKAKYLESKEEMKRKLKEGEIEQYQFDQWDFRTRNKYAEQGGAGFDPTTGDYNPIDATPLGTNLEAEILKITADWGKMSEQNIYETFVNKFGVENLDPTTVANLKQKYKSSDPELKQQLYRLLSSSDRFQNYWKEAAELDYYNTTRKQYGASPYSKAGQESLNEFNLEQIEKRRQYYKNEKSKVKHKEDLEQINNLENKLEGYISEAEKKGTLNQLAESLYIEDYINSRMGDISGVAGDLLDMEEITYSTIGTIDGGGKEAKEQLDKIKDRKIHTKVSGLSTDEGRMVPTAEGGFTQADIVHDVYPLGMTSMGVDKIEEINENLRNTVDIKNITSGKSDAPGATLYENIGMNVANAELSPLLASMDEETRKSYTTDFSNAIARVAQVGDGIGTLLDERNQATLRVDELQGTIDQTVKAYNKAGSDREKAELKERIKELNIQQKVNLVAAQNEEQDIIEFINGAVNKGDKEIIKLFNDNNKDYIETARKLREANYSKLKNFNRKLKEAGEGTTSLGGQDVWYLDKDNKIYFNNFKYDDAQSLESRLAYNKLLEELTSTDENASIKQTNGMFFNPSQLTPNSGLGSTYRNMNEQTWYPEGAEPSIESFAANIKDKKAETKTIIDNAIKTGFKELKPIGGNSWNDFYNERYTPKSVKPTAVILTDEVAAYAPDINLAAKGTSEGEGGILGRDPLTAAGVEVYVSDPTIGPTPMLTKESIVRNPIVGFDYKSYGKENISYVGSIQEVNYQTADGTEKDERANDLIFAVNSNITTDADIAARIKERLNDLRSGVTIMRGEQAFNFSYEDIKDAFGDGADTQRAQTIKRDLINAYKASNPATAYIGYEGSSLNPSADAARSLEKDFTNIEKVIASKGELDDDSLAAYDNAVHNFAHIFLRTDFQNKYLKYLGKAQTLMNNMRGDTDFVDLTAEAANYYEEEERTLPEDIVLSDGTVIPAGQKIDGLRSYGLSYVKEGGQMAAKVTEFFTPIVNGNVDINAQFQLSGSKQFPLSNNITPEELFSLEFKFGIGSQDEAVYSGKDRIVPPMFR